MIKTVRFVVYCEIAWDNIKFQFQYGYALVLTLVIDGNGLGSGFMDYMVKENFDNGIMYPGYCSTNDEHYRQSATLC